MKEKQIIELLTKHYIEHGYKRILVGQWKHKPDLVLNKNNELIGIEAKGSWFKGRYGSIEQAKEYRKYVNKLYIAIPSELNKQMDKNLMEEHGLGLIVIDENNSIIKSIEPKINNNPLKPDIFTNNRKLNKNIRTEKRKGLFFKKFGNSYYLPIYKTIIGQTDWNENIELKADVLPIIDKDNKIISYIIEITEKNMIDKIEKKIIRLKGTSDGVE